MAESIFDRVDRELAMGQRKGPTITAPAAGAATDSIFDQVDRVLAAESPRDVTISSRQPSLVDRLLDSVPNRERLSEGVPGVIAGAVKQGAATIAAGGDLLRAGWNYVAPDSLDVDRPNKDYEPSLSTPYQRLGARGVQAAEAAAAVPGVVAAAKAVPGVIARAAGASTARAGANLSEVANAARGVAVDAAKPGAEALRLMEMAERGGSMPRAAQQFLYRVTDKSKGDLTFEEARDFATNLSRLSANEYARLSPPVQAQVRAMRQALHEALTDAAETVGRGEQYAGAVAEYARGARLNERASAAGRAAVKTGVGLLGLDYLVNRIRALMGQ